MCGVSHTWEWVPRGGVGVHTWRGQRNFDFHLHAPSGGKGDRVPHMGGGTKTPPGPPGRGQWGDMGWHVVPWTATVVPWGSVEGRGAAFGTPVNNWGAGHPRVGGPHSPPVSPGCG